MKLQNFIREFYDHYETAPSILRIQDDLRNNDISISKTSIRRYLSATGQRYVVRKFPRQNSMTLALRARWASYCVSNRDFFDRLVFSDEKRFEIEPVPGGSRVLFSPNPHDPRRTRATAGRHRYNIMVFGMFFPRGGTSCLTFVPSGSDGTVTAGYYRSLLRGFIADNMKASAPNGILLEDNASSHRANSYLAVPFDRVNHGFYPPYSPDFNAIERL